MCRSTRFCGHREFGLIPYVLALQEPATPAFTPAPITPVKTLVPRKPVPLFDEDGCYIHYLPTHGPNLYELKMVGGDHSASLWLVDCSLKGRAGAAPVEPYSPYSSSIRPRKPRNPRNLSFIDISLRFRRFHPC